MRAIPPAAAGEGPAVRAIPPAHTTGAHAEAPPLPPQRERPALSVAEGGAGGEGEIPIWDTADLLEFAGGSIAKVFGPEYAAIDGYARRVRLPLPPYLLVSRITKLGAQRGEFKPSTVTTEYDIPIGAWYSVDGQPPLAIAVESGQCDLLLISYLGIDFPVRASGSTACSTAP